MSENCIKCESTKERLFTGFSSKQFKISPKFFTNMTKTKVRKFIIFRNFFFQNFIFFFKLQTILNFLFVSKISNFSKDFYLSKISNSSKISHLSKISNFSKLSYFSKTSTFSKISYFPNFEKFQLFARISKISF